MDTLHGAEARDKVFALIKDSQVAMMATADDSGRLFHARPMVAPKLDKQEDFEGSLYFFTGATSPKVEEIKANPNVLLTYANPDKQSYVSLSGQATVVRDPAKVDELWTKEIEAWFPDGKSDPNLVLIRFDAEEAEFWDAPNKFVLGAAYLKSLVTGERPHVGNAGKADLAH